MEKNTKIKNKMYLNFINKGEIQTIKPEEFKKVLDSINGSNRKQARSLLIVLYLTGARPVEVLYLRPKDYVKEKSYIKITIKGAKRGLTRPFYLQYKNPLVKELWAYCMSLPDEINMFWHFTNDYKRVYKTKSGETKIYHETTDKLRYWFKKWFSVLYTDGIPPYFLRHNRFSKLAEKGATAEEIRLLKGGKTLDSVFPYLHLSSKTGKKLASKID